MSGETGERVSGWTVDTLRQHLQTQYEDLSVLLHQQMRDMRSMLNERYDTQTKAIDAAKVAQETAMSTAFTAADKAVVTAQLAQEKAINKAETAADKRFELLNELRTGVATKEQIDALEKQLNSLASRVDRTEGQTSGKQQQVTDTRSMNMQTIAMIAIFASVLGAVVAKALGL